MSAEESWSGVRPTMLVSDDLRRGNVASVARSLLVEGPMARAEIADKLGLTRATVTRVTAQLIGAGLVREQEPRKTSSGRPMVPLALNGQARAVISVHLGAAEMRVGVVDLSGRIEREDRYAYRGTAPADVAALIEVAVSNLKLGAQPEGRVIGLSGAIGGWVDPERQTIVNYAPFGWRDIPLAQVFPDVGLPRRVDQLVSALAVAERIFGMARGHDDFVVLWSGNVLGAASVIGGAVQRGHRAGAGGIEHLPALVDTGPCLCGRSNCLGMAVTDSAIMSAAVARGIAGEDETLKDVLRREVQGDRRSGELLAGAAETFGSAAAIIADLQAPPLMILAGLITTSPGYGQAFARGLRRCAERGDGVEVRLSEFGDTAPTVASAALLIDEFFRDPLAFTGASTGG